MNPFKILPLIITIQIIIGLTLTPAPSKTNATNPNTIHFPDSNTELTVEVADSPSERRKGLMYREKLPIDKGMLFIFPKEKQRGFWMKNTLIPLDMIFVDAEGNIINIEEAVPEPNTSEENLKIYKSDKPAKFVIETNLSFTERKNIEEGEKVVIPS